MENGNFRLFAATEKWKYDFLSSQKDKRKSTMAVSADEPIDAYYLRKTPLIPL
jgi:hypothetical protein